MNITLYEITADIAEILGSEEWTEEQVAEMDRLEMVLEAKADNILMFCDNLDGAIDAHKKEEARLSARRKAMETRKERIKAYLQNCMEAIGRTELDLVTRRAVIQTNPPAVVIDNEAKIPARYFVIIPESSKLDKKALAADLKAGPVEGAHLERGKSLRIK